ncbi:hypothetical protein WDU94_015320 [Cyamophila willieti]
MEVIELDENAGWRLFTLYKIRKNSTVLRKSLEGEGSLDDIIGLGYYNHMNQTRRGDFYGEPLRIVEVLIHLDQFKGWHKKTQ